MVQAILSGLIGAVSSIMTKVFMPIINAILKVVTKYIVAPLLNVAINIVNYFLGFAMYGIVIFLLALIDYVELIFRLLAGLEVDGMRLTLDGGKDGSSDLLVQLLRSEGIQQAFLSMVIVGLFLLVISTIYQIIKTEYTTEGAKNSKGPILNKAFKGVATLMMLPLLTIFGVFMGNQILGLIDTATKGGNTNGDQPTIAGTLFVTAASEAYYEANEMRVIITSMATAPVELLMNIIPISWNAITNAWGAADTEGVESNFFDIPIFGGATSENRDVVESGFICQSKGNYAGVVGGYRYYYIDEVTTYYDISQINYLLLIFGSAMVIKTLYYASFGMIVRLFHCGILFVISPMIIGVSPVNDGTFKKWTRSFMGKAISAYGVVMAMNVFFIVVKVLLSLDIEFTNIDDYMFGNEIMVGLIKSIFVIGGCTMVEKFSKELGGYFGADDAISAGKELEKATKEQVKKVVVAAGEVAMGIATTAVTIAATVATAPAGGAGGLAAGGLAAALKAGGTAAIKGGVKVAAKTAAKNAAKNAAKMATKEGMKQTLKEGAKQTLKDGAKNLGNKLMSGGQNMADSLGFGNKWESMRGNVLKGRAGKADGIIDNLTKKNGGLQDQIAKRNDSNKQLRLDLNKPGADKEAIEEQIRANEIKNAFDQAQIDINSQGIASAEEDKKAVKDFNDDGAVEQRAGARRSAISARKHMNSETIKNFGGWGAGFKEFSQSFEKARGEVSKQGGDQGAQDYKNHQKIIADADEAKYKKTHSESLEASEVRMLNLMIHRATEESSKTVEDANLSNMKQVQNIENLAALGARARSNGDNTSAELYAEQMKNAIMALSQVTGQNIEMENGVVVNKGKITQNINVDMNVINRIADAGRAQGLAGDKLLEYIKTELSKEKDMTKQSLEAFQKALKEQIEELKK